MKIIPLTPYVLPTAGASELFFPPHDDYFLSCSPKPQQDWTSGFALCFHFFHMSTDLLMAFTVRRGTWIYTLLPHTPAFVLE